MKTPEVQINRKENLPGSIKRWAASIYVAAIVHIAIIGVLDYELKFKKNINEESERIEKLVDEPEFVLDYFLNREIEQGVIDEEKASEVKAKFFNTVLFLKNSYEGDPFRLLFEIRNLMRHYQPNSRHVSGVIELGEGNCEARAIGAFLYLKAIDPEHKIFEEVFFQMFKQAHVRVVVKIGGKFYHLENTKGATLMGSPEKAHLVNGEEVLAKQIDYDLNETRDSGAYDYRPEEVSVSEDVEKVKTVSSFFSALVLDVPTEALESVDVAGPMVEVVEEKAVYSGVFEGRESSFKVNVVAEMGAGERIRIARNGSFTEKYNLARSPDASREELKILSEYREFSSQKVAEEDYFIILWEVINNKNVSFEVLRDVLMSDLVNVNSENQEIYLDASKSVIITSKTVIETIIFQRYEIIFQYPDVFLNHKNPYARGALALLSRWLLRVDKQNFENYEKINEFLKKDPDIRVRNLALGNFEGDSVMDSRFGEGTEDLVDYFEKLVFAFM